MQNLAVKAESTAAQDQANKRSAKNSVVKTDKLSLTFQTADGPVYALSNVNLTIEQGDFVSFIGPSRLR